MAKQDEFGAVLKLAPYINVPIGKVGGVDLGDIRIDTRKVPAEILLRVLDLGFKNKLLDTRAFDADEFPDADAKIRAVRERAVALRDALESGSWSIGGGGGDPIMNEVWEMLYAALEVPAGKRREVKKSLRAAILGAVAKQRGKPVPDADADAVFEKARLTYVEAARKELERRAAVSAKNLALLADI